MTRWERIQAVLAGERPDRTPVTAWRHFPYHEADPDDLARTTLAFQSEYDWDLVKLQPSSVHFSEAWGGRYDYGSYQGNHPLLVQRACQGPADLVRVEPLPGNAGPFAQQLQVIRTLRAAWGEDVPLIQTVFSPLSVVESLLTGALPKDRQESHLAHLLAEHAGVVHQAARAVAATLADYCRHLLQAGADGIFYAVTSQAREPYLTRDEYRAFARPYDLEVLNAVAAARLNVLHICGSHIHFDDFLDYPVPVLSWAATQPGNPSLAEAARRSRFALMAGVPEKTVFLQGDPQAVTAAVQAAEAATGGRRLIAAPECSYPPAVPAENVRALRRAVG